MIFLVYLRWVVLVFLLALPIKLSLHEKILSTRRFFATCHLPTRTTNLRWHQVHATVYYPSGLPTASGWRIPASYALRRRQYRCVALSRDLHRHFAFGDTLEVRGHPQDPYWDKELDGLYIVRDLMNKRFTKRIDILSRRGHERDIGLWRAQIRPYHVLRRTHR